MAHTHTHTTTVQTLTGSYDFYNWRRFSPIVGYRSNTFSNSFELVTVFNCCVKSVMERIQRIKVSFYIFILLFINGNYYYYTLLLRLC